MKLAALRRLRGTAYFMLILHRPYYTNYGRLPCRNTKNCQILFSAFIILLFLSRKCTYKNIFTADLMILKYEMLTYVATTSQFLISSELIHTYL